MRALSGRAQFFQGFKGSGMGNDESVSPDRPLKVFPNELGGFLPESAKDSKSGGTPAEPGTLCHHSSLLFLAEQADPYRNRTKRGCHPSAPSSLTRAQVVSGAEAVGVRRHRCRCHAGRREPGRPISTSAAFSAEGMRGADRGGCWALGMRALHRRKRPGSPARGRARVYLGQLAW